MLAQAVGPNLTKLLHDQLHLMFAWGLVTLAHALVENKEANGKAEVEEGKDEEAKSKKTEKENGKKEEEKKKDEGKGGAEKPK